MRYLNSKVSRTVLRLLQTDMETRRDDIYLYRKVVEEISPELLGKSFEDVLAEHESNGYVHFETVLRTRAAIQREHSELVDSETYRKRKKGNNHLHSCYAK